MGVDGWFLFLGVCLVGLEGCDVVVMELIEFCLMVLIGCYIVGNI